MVAPRPPQSRRTRQFLHDVVLFVVAASVFATLLSIFGPTHYIIDQHHAVSTDSRSVPGPLKVMSESREISASKREQPTRKKELDIEADVTELDHEEMFQATMKSCLPSEGEKNKKGNPKCGEYIPEPTGNDKKKVQRVAILSPPGDLSTALVKRVEQVMHHHNQRQNKLDLEIDVLETSHVPPYGYGKTHGLTKVLRLAPQPLVLEVTDSLRSLLRPGESHAIITLEDLKAGLRQIIRFHCRLSHLSAHTAIMSVGYEDMLMEPHNVVKDMHTFLVPRDVPEKIEGDDDVQFAPDDDQNGLFEAEEAYGTQILSHIQQVAQIDVNQALDEVLQHEMKRSNNLSKWPCESFWTSGEPSDPTKLSPLLQKLASSLSPDCNSPIGNCWVERDKCESKGDGLCKKNK